MPELFRAVYPKLPNVAKFRGYILNVLVDFSEIMLQDMRMTTATWKHKPVFKRQLLYKFGDVIIKVYTDDPAWNYLDHGTSKRYAVMTSDFESKTSPGWIGSRAGKGKKKFVGRTPQPGIKRRGWSEKIAQMHQKAFYDRVQNAIAKGLNWPTP